MWQSLKTVCHSPYLGLIALLVLCYGINDNILDTRSISKDATNNYELRIYIHEDATDWTGKHYHYKVVLNNGK